MARKRQLDPEFFKDEDMADIPFEGRLFYAGTWCFCEDTGVFEVKHRTLKAEIFPYDNLDTKSLYEQLRDKGMYVEYSVNGAIYAFIRGFHNRQTIQWPSQSFLPLPPKPFVARIPSKIRNLNKSSLSLHVALTEQSARVEKNRIELNRIELIELDHIDININSLKKLFNSKTKLKDHLLRTRGMKEERVDEILKKHFSNLK